MQPIACRIKEEIKMMPNRKTEYNNTINLENIFGECNSTLITCLLKLSPCFKKSWNAAMMES